MFRALIICFTIIFSTVPSYANTVKLQTGTFIPLLLAQTIESGTLQNGDDVFFSVAMDIKVNSKTVIQAGTLVTANVTQIQKSGMIGQGGTFTVSFIQTTAIDGQQIMLRGNKTWAGDDETTGTVVVGVVLCPLALLNSGEEAQAGEGAQVRAIVGASYDIKT